MKVSPVATALLLTLAALATAPRIGAQTEAGAQFTPGPRDGRQFDAWTLRCQLVESGSERCEMFQQQSDTATSEVVLHAAVGYVPAVDKYGLLVVMPLGISLPPGVFIRIDEGAPQPVSVERCDQQGCRVEILLDDDLLEKLKAGSKLVAIFHAYDDDGKRERVGVPVSLKGFTAAFNEISR